MFSPKKIYSNFILLMRFLSENKKESTTKDIKAMEQSTSKLTRDTSN
jgi:hypothetical protein